MLSRCLATPTKLARTLEWHLRSSRSGGGGGITSSITPANTAVMAIDVSERRIGVAIARWGPCSNNIDDGDHRDGFGNFDDDEHDDGGGVGSVVVPLGSVPFMPSPHNRHRNHHHHRTTLSRSELALEAGSVLARVARDENVRAVLVRWPADSEQWNRSQGDKQRGLEEDEVGTLGYRRGRILYFLEQCCLPPNVVVVEGGGGDSDASSDVALSESMGDTTNGSMDSASAFIDRRVRPFAFWETATSVKCDHGKDDDYDHLNQNQQWISKQPEHDKYGNPMQRMDKWGRMAIFGRPPSLPEWVQQRGGHYYYSSKGRRSGARRAGHYNRSGYGASNNGVRVRVISDIASNDGVVNESEEDWKKKHPTSLTTDEAKGIVAGEEGKGSSAAAVRMLREFSQAHLQGGAGMRREQRRHPNSSGGGAAAVRKPSPSPPCRCGNEEGFKTEEEKERDEAWRVSGVDSDWRSSARDVPATVAKASARCHTAKKSLLAPQSSHPRLRRPTTMEGKKKKIVSLVEAR